MAATNFDDDLETSYDGEILRGLAGDDRLSSAFNRTTLIGDAGDDIIVTDLFSEADETVAAQYGNDGNDILSAIVQAGGSRIELLQDGGDGDDQITGRAVLGTYDFFQGKSISNSASGGAGNDTIQLSAILNVDSGAARNEASGGSGDDRIFAYASTNFYGTQSIAFNRIDGGDGNDQITASASGSSNFGDIVTNELTGGAGDDIIRGYVFADSNSSDAYGRNVLEGGEGNDLLQAFNETDGENTYTEVESVLDGGNGDDELTARSIALSDIGLDGVTVASHQLSGGNGVDILTSSIVAEAATARIEAQLTGGQGDDRLSCTIEIELGSISGTPDAATIVNRLDGGAGNDILDVRVSVALYQYGYDDVVASPSVTNELHGGEGDDTISAIIESVSDNPETTVAGSSLLFGGGGEDIIRVEGGDGNILNGGAGDDRLIGGSGSDTFVFAFAVSPGELQTVTFRNGQTPSKNANARAWENYVEQLSAWRSDLQGYGGDLDDRLSSVTLRGKRGSMGETFSFDNTYTFSTGAVVAGEGFDNIEGFSGDDMLQLNGVTQTEFSDLFALSVEDFDGNGTLDTVLTWNEEGGGIVLLDAQYENLDDLTLAGVVTFG